MHKRVIVNIVSEQTIPSYIFIKEMYRKGDELFFISSERMEKWHQSILNTLNMDSVPHISLLLKDGNEEKWNFMTDAIEQNLHSDYEYIVNITGGTKLMSLAVHSVFEKYKSKFYYIPYPKNELLQPQNTDDTAILLKYRVSINEYLSSYSIRYKEKQLVMDPLYTTKFFTIFTSEGFLTSEDLEAIDRLRAYRNKKKISISETEQRMFTKDEKYKPIPSLSLLLEKIEFPRSGENDILLMNEIEYLTGGWFEEYIYNQIQLRIAPQDMALGIEIMKTDGHNQNDLDVVFTYGNKLFVIECKTGISGESIFNQTVHKATALKETLLGLNGNTFIYSLSSDNKDQFKTTAKNMNLRYYDRKYFTDSALFDELIEDIKIIARD